MWRSNGPLMDRRDWGSQEGRRVVELEVKVPSLSPTRPGAHLPELPRRRGHVRGGALHAHPDGEGGGGHAVAHPGPRGRPLHVDQAQQSVSYPFVGGGDGSCVGLCVRVCTHTRATESCCPQGWLDQGSGGPLGTALSSGAPCCLGMTRGTEVQGARTGCLGREYPSGDLQEGQVSASGVCWHEAC